MDNKKFTIKMIIEVVFAALGFWLADVISSKFFDHSAGATIGFMIAIFLVLFGVEWLLERLWKKHCKKVEEEEKERERLKAERAARLAAEEAQEEEESAAPASPFAWEQLSDEERRAAEIAIERIYGNGAEDKTDEDEDDEVEDDEVEETDDEEANDNEEGEGEELTAEELLENEPSDDLDDLK
jgi:hypothetical protein